MSFLSAFAPNDSVAERSVLLNPNLWRKLLRATSVEQGTPVLQEYAHEAVNEASKTLRHYQEQHRLLVLRGDGSGSLLLPVAQRNILDTACQRIQRVLSVYHAARLDKIRRANFFLYTETPELASRLTPGEAEFAQKLAEATRTVIRTTALHGVDGIDTTVAPDADAEVWEELAGLPPPAQLVQGVAEENAVHITAVFSPVATICEAGQLEEGVSLVPFGSIEPLISNNSLEVVG